MKVRQSVSVTSELGDPNNLASFDGELGGETCFVFLHCRIRINGLQHAPGSLNQMFSQSC